MSKNRVTDRTEPRKNPEYVPTLLPDGSWILFNPSLNDNVVVSPTAGILWELCSDKMEVKDLIREICALYPIEDSSRVRRDAFKIVSVLHERGLLLIE